MLVGTCELIKKRCLTAVLVPYQRECQKCTVGERITVTFAVEFTFLTETRVFIGLTSGQGLLVYLLL